MSPESIVIFLCSLLSMNNTDLDKPVAIYVSSDSIVFFNLQHKKYVSYEVQDWDRKFITGETDSSKIIISHPAFRENSRIYVFTKPDNVYYELKVKKMFSRDTIYLHPRLPEREKLTKTEGLLRLRHHP